jgi:MFS family permease
MCPGPARCIDRRRHSLDREGQHGLTRLLYAPATVLLGIMSLPAGWASDRFGAPAMMVVMFAGMGLSSIACGLVPAGDTLALSLGLCGIGAFGAIYHAVGIGWVIRTAKEQGRAMGVNGLWGSARLALYRVVPGVLITLASWRAAFIVPGALCVAMAVVVAWQAATGHSECRRSGFVAARNRPPRAAGLAWDQAIGGRVSKVEQGERRSSR